MNARQILQQALAEGRLRPLDLHFALRMQRLAGTKERPELLLAAALVSHGVGQGHVCCDLTQWAERPPWNLLTGESVSLPPLPVWREALLRTGVVGLAGSHLPLILDPCDRLYLARYQRFEQELATALLARAGQWAAGIDHARLREGLRRFFPGKAAAGIDWQQVAAAVAVLRPFCVISGGPGTGKTRTVTAILALVLEQANAPLRVALAAPTGKAAARLAESMRLARGELNIAPEIALQLPDTASTLHRLLGFRPDRVEPRHNAADPLPYDLLVVDEASMVDLSLMARLLSALRPDTRLILLGDRDQLASVEAGRVLGDICGHEQEAGYSAEQCRVLAELAATELVPAAQSPPLADHLAILRRSYRFGESSGIGRAARAVNTGEAEQLLEILRGSAFPDVSLHSVAPAALPALLREWLLPRMTACLTAASPAARLRAYGAFRILGAMHDGPFGVRRLNLLAEELLVRAGLLDVRFGPNYHGRPLLITGNDSQTGLFNGDVGIILADEEERRQAWFESADGVRALSPARLPAHETVYAMTVHKSQGSEFDDVLLILPEEDNRALSRELLYTAVTRARHSLVVIAQPEPLRQAVQQCVHRISGLSQALRS